MNNILIAILVVGGTGLMFGLLLAFASIIFKVEKDERIELIEAELPGANCGACGFAGCSAYAEAVVKDGASVSCCSVGKAAVANKIAEIMGVESGVITPMVARVMCIGKCGVAEDKYEYYGVGDCSAAAKLAGGAKACPNGCLGLGSCVKACMFGAISVVDGVAVVDSEKCTACGMCIKACPKKVIELIPVECKVVIPCKNSEKGALTNKYCKVGCIACRICEKNCPEQAVSVIDNCAVINYDKCSGCGLCAEKCPKKLICITNPAK